MSKKKKTKRDKEKYPDLKAETSLKLRRDYIDNRHYVKGVKEKGKLVMPELSEKDKEFLNQFNREYYGGVNLSKEKQKVLHKTYIDEDTVADIKDQIRKIKKKRKKIFDKSPNTTTEKDRDTARMYSDQIDEMLDFLNRNYAQKEVYDLNNQRNRCFLNRNKASNEIKLVSWESLNEDSIVLSDPELYYQYIIDGEDED
jgi:hypothetical protein